MKKKKILFVTTRLIYPVNDGRKVVLYNYCKGLSVQLQNEVSLFTFADDEEKSIKQPDFIKNIYYGNLPGKAEKLKNILIKSFILRKWPFQVSVYYSKSAKEKLLKVVEKYKPDIVICDMARTAEYLKDLDDKKYVKILDMDDMLSKRYKRQAESLINGSDAIGAYSKKLPKFLRKFTNISFLMKYVLNKESKLLEKYEVEASKYYKDIVFVSPIEAEEFNKKLGVNKSRTITIGVDYDYFSEDLANIKCENKIVYLGNMNVAHNKDAVSNFVDNIFPHVLDKKPDTVLKIVGKCSDDYKDQFKNNKNIQVTGEVSDIRKEVSECAVSVAPLKYGTGIKTKILETMAMGVPVVTNSIGNEGLALESHKHIIVEDDNKKMAREIVYLLSNAHMREELSKKSKKYIKENHKWENIMKEFEKIL